MLTHRHEAIHAPLHRHARPARVSGALQATGGLLVYEALLPMGKGVIEDRDKELSCRPIENSRPWLNSITLRWFIKRDELLVSSMLLEPMATQVAPFAGSLATATATGLE